MPVDTGEFRKAQAQIAELMTAITGNPKLGQPGIVNRLIVMEDKIDQLIENSDTQRGVFDGTDTQKAITAAIVALASAVVFVVQRLIEGGAP